MELIIIPTLTTIALITMQALEFMTSRRFRGLAPSRYAGAELADADALRVLESGTSASTLPHAAQDGKQRVEHAA